MGKKDHRMTKLPEEQIANLLWEEWKYRHEIYWQSIYRWGLAVGFITIAPYYFQERLISTLGWQVVAFPAVAALLAIFAAWHLGAEYVRLGEVSQRYHLVLGEHAPKRLPKGLFSRSISKAVTRMFLFVGLVLQALNAWVLLKLVGV
ncbi:MAG: hypothetical protein HYZ26_03095 [Chloroflexi bacterium]|nr:hypothetical protein [Chloroflexota bacterium]